MTAKASLEDFVEKAVSRGTFNTLATLVYKDRALYDITFHSLLVFEVLNAPKDTSIWTSVTGIIDGGMRGLLTKILEKPSDRGRVLRLFQKYGLSLNKSTSGNGDIYCSWYEVQKQSDGRDVIVILHAFFKADAEMLPAPLFTILHVKKGQTKISTKIAKTQATRPRILSQVAEEVLKKNGVEHMAAEEFSKIIGQVAAEPPSPFTEK